MQFIKDKVEFDMLKIWKNVLNNDDINLNSNFFEVGGHSLLIFQLISEINKKFNVEILPTTILQNITPRKISNEIRKNNNYEKNLIVEFNNNDSEVQLVFFHPGGGGVFCYSDMISKLDPEKYNIIGVQARGINDFTLEPLWTLEELTSLYSKELLPFIKGKKNIFIGWSSGGTLAFQMCYIFENDFGIEIEKLILLDTLAKYPNSIDNDNTLTSKKDIWEKFCLSKNVNVPNIQDKSIDDIIKFMNSNAYNIGILDKDIASDIAKQELKISVANFNMLRKNQFNLKIKPPIFWIVSEEHYNNIDFMKIHKSIWESRTLDNLFIYKTKGNHKNMIFGSKSEYLHKIFNNFM